MSHRVTHIKTFDISKRRFKTYDGALLSADAIKSALKYICKKKTGSCIAYIGVSEYPSDAKPHTTSIGKVEFFNANGKKARKIEPHIHMTLVANPCETIVQDLEAYCKKNHFAIEEKKDKEDKKEESKSKELTSVSKNCEEYLKERLEYVINQTTNFRMANIGDREVLEPYATQFCHFVEEISKEKGYKKSIFKKHILTS